MPNPRRSSTCDCTCVLTRIDHCLVTLSCLPCTFCFVPAYAKFAHEFLTLFHRPCVTCISLAFLADFTLSDSTALTHFNWIERHDHSVHMSSILQAQQLYTAGIPLLEAYLLPMANNRTCNECLSQEQNSR